MDKGFIGMRNLDEGLFYLFAICSVYVVKLAFEDFNIQVAIKAKKNNLVDKNTQTDEEEETEDVEDHEGHDENDAEEHSFEEVVPIQVKRKYFSLW